MAKTAAGLPARWQRPRPGCVPEGKGRCQAACPMAKAAAGLRAEWQGPLPGCVPDGKDRCRAACRMGRASGGLRAGWEGPLPGSVPDGKGRDRGARRMARTATVSGRRTAKTATFRARSPALFRRMPPCTPRCRPSIRTGSCFAWTRSTNPFVVESAPGRRPPVVAALPSPGCIALPSALPPTAHRLFACSPVARRNFGRKNRASKFRTFHEMHRWIAGSKNVSGTSTAYLARDWPRGAGMLGGGTPRHAGYFMNRLASRAASVLTVDTTKCVTLYFESNFHLVAHS